MTEVRSRQRPPASEEPPKGKKKSVFSDDRVAQADLPPEQRKRGRIQHFDPEIVRDFAEGLYRNELGEGDTRSMIRKDGDNGEKLRVRAGSYDSYARSFLTVLRNRGIEVPPLPKRQE